MTDKITLLLVDDEPSVRRGLRMRLELEPDVEVVGEAGDGANAVRLAESLAPAVVVMDVEMPAKNGIEATSEIVSRVPGVAVVVLSMHDDAATLRKAHEAGASAFVSKHRMDDGLIEAIRGAAREQGGATDDSE
jgi:DNA-binding NarL/FixJ family response regulator